MELKDFVSKAVIDLEEAIKGIQDKITNNYILDFLRKEHWQMTMGLCIFTSFLVIYFATINYSTPEFGNVEIWDWLHSLILRDFPLAYIMGYLFYFFNIYLPKKRANNIAKESVVEIKKILISLMKSWWWLDVKGHLDLTFDELEKKVCLLIDPENNIQIFQNNDSSTLYFISRIDEQCNLILSLSSLIDTSFIGILNKVSSNYTLTQSEIAIKNIEKMNSKNKNNRRWYWGHPSKKILRLYKEIDNLNTIEY